MSKRNREDNTLSEMVSKKHKQQLKTYAYSETIEIIVRSEEKVFRIHKDLLAARSPYFTARFKQPWSTDEDAQFKLPEMNASCFEVIFSWFYTGEICLDIGAVNENEGESQGFGNKAWILLYQHADMLLLTDFQNQMVDADLDYRDHNDNRLCWTLYYARKWYEYGLTQTPYHRLYLDEVIQDLLDSEEDLGHNFEDRIQKWRDYPDCAIDILVNIHRYRAENWQRVTKGDRCRYHIHKDGQRCGQEVANKSGGYTQRIRMFSKRADVTDRSCG